jgi:Zn-dependent protease with chaperone function
MDAEKKIIDISNELKTRYLIDPYRKIKASKNIPYGFKASVLTSNTIDYNPNISGFNDDMIRFCLLHEEGHLKRGQYGKPAFLFLVCLSFIPLLLILLLNLFGLKVGPIIATISVIFVLFVIFTSTRILIEPFHWDEYGSDEFASKILRDNYDIKRPSEIVRKTLNALDALPASFDSSKLLSRLCLAFFDYHPSIDQRVRNIIEAIDEK